jgi:hypothetical protein
MDHQAQRRPALLATRRDIAIKIMASEQEAVAIRERAAALGYRTTADYVRALALQVRHRKTA